MKRAFTLIELLVVIAIIAILAAILFPVFAQAKAAAKAAASISNDKQNTLAVIMYEGDSNDVLPPACAWNTGSDPLWYGPGLSFSTWAYLAEPYMKNGDLFQDPLAPKITSNPWGWAVVMSMYPCYGYNYTGLSPYQGGSPGTATCKQFPVSGTVPAQPADTVFLVSKFSINETQFGVGTGVGFAFTPYMDNGPALTATVDAPECYTIVPWCQDNWGANSTIASWWVMPIVAGGDTGGASLRAAGKSVVSYVDGHVTKMSDYAAAAGTNYTPYQDHSLTIINDVTHYLWDIL